LLCTVVNEMFCRQRMSNSEQITTNSQHQKGKH
jgi:hypothetical protein